MCMFATVIRDHEESAAKAEENLGQLKRQLGASEAGKRHEEAALSRTTMEREQMEAELKEQVAEHSSKVQECLDLLEERKLQRNTMQTSLEVVTTR